MEVPTFMRDLEARGSCKEDEYRLSQQSSQPMLIFTNYNDKSGVQQECNQAEANLFALTSKLSCLGQKAQQLEQFFRSQSSCPLGQDDQQQQAKSALNSILGEVILTSASILSQCESLSNPQRAPKKEGENGAEILEINEDDILAEHTHFCKICGKGFRRDGNVRIHMRSHGNQYKTQEALMSNKPKAGNSYYSCPFDDCRRNKRHPNFKPLKSMACLRNHYRRSHCAKMYTCNKCGKEFSFVGDLKTHGNKCGHTTWRCSCNTTFSTKDKLFRHVTLFQEGHKPVLPSHTSSAVPPPLNGGKPSMDNKKVDHCSQDANALVSEGQSAVAEGPLAYGGDEDLLMLNAGSVGIQQRIVCNAGYDIVADHYARVRGRAGHYGDHSSYFDYRGHLHRSRIPSAWTLQVSPRYTLTLRDSIGTFSSDNTDQPQIHPHHGHYRSGPYTP